MSKTKAYKAGYERGSDAGSWAIDGNTSTEAACRILKGITEGDPEIMDMMPSPLNGEWAGESISELSDQYGIDLSDDDKACDFEAGYSDGYWSEVERSATAAIN